uniref:BTB domain containing 19 n=1 Tax=Podarcis muralis TaxID=64176 RepID=A0A670IRB9_PODMU
MGRVAGERGEQGRVLRSVDVTFLVGREQKEIFAHRCLLTSRCQALHAMLSHPQEMQAPLILSHVQPEVFLAVIEYLYTNNVTLNNSIAAVAYGQVDLQMHCLAFIESCTQDVVLTRGFLELSELAMQTILRSDCLAIDEVKLIRAVREWAHVGSAVLDRTVHDVAATVVPGLRLDLLSPSELTTLEEENKKDQMIPVESLAQAWKMHALRKGCGMRSSLCQRRRGTLSREHQRPLDPQHK